MITRILLFSIMFLLQSFCFGLENLTSLILYDEYKSFYFADDNVLSNSSDAIVRKIYDQNNNAYIVKQIVDTDIDEQFLLIRDLIASGIGVSCGIPVNEVYLIPANIKCKIKVYNWTAATVHRFIEGVCLEDNAPKFLNKDFALQQQYLDHYEWQKKWVLEDCQQGFSRKFIESMSLHNDLPKIVAFDTFVGNFDRSLPNIFYNEKENRFYGIDQAAAFNNKNLSKLALDRLKELHHKDYFKSCCGKIIDSLRLYRDTLIKLYNKITPENVCLLFKTYSSHIYVWSEDFSKHVHGRCYYHCKAFESNYRFTKELIELLDEIL